MTLTTADRIKIAYTLLPPPLAALPAKYWTSISLLLHSYTVGRTFEVFVEGYAKASEEAPLPEESFLIGFLHDMGQKLRLRGKPSENGIIKWFSERVEALGYTPGEAWTYVKYLYTNPAETRTDPLYPRKIWTLLWLADRLQGISNPIDIMPLLHTVKEELGANLTIKLISVSLPQPFLRTLISKAVYEELVREAMDSPDIIVPVSTPMGVALITSNPEIEVHVDWDEIRNGFTGKGVLPESVEDMLKWNMDCCDNKECYNMCKGRTKPGECKEHGFTKRDCDKGVYPGKSGNSYRIALVHYGRKHKVGLSVILPREVKTMFQGLGLIGVEYVKGDRICAVCGMRTPVGTPVDFILSFDKRLTTEQWVRKLYPGSVNRLMQEAKDVVLDPLCLGDVIVRSGMGANIITTLTLRPPTPTVVLTEIAPVIWNLLSVLGTGIPKSAYVERLFYSDEWSKALDAVLPQAGSAEQKIYYDMFASAIYIPYRNLMQRHQDEWIRDMVTAGVLSSWGLYPLTISRVPPMAPAEALLTYYKGQRPLYSFAPSDKRLSTYTPYVAVAMASLAELNYRKNVGGESLPALLEVLDYPPGLSPVLVQYGSPHLYSILESLRSRLGVV